MIPLCWIIAAFAAGLGYFEGWGWYIVAALFFLAPLRSLGGEAGGGEVAPQPAPRNRDAERAAWTRGQEVVKAANENAKQRAVSPMGWLLSLPVNKEKATEEEKRWMRNG